jgi:hypothetical protein
MWLGKETERNAQCILSGLVPPWGYNKPYIYCSYSHNGETEHPTNNAGTIKWAVKWTMSLLSHINFPYGLFFPSTTLVSSPLKTQFLLYALHTFTQGCQNSGARSPGRMNFVRRCFKFACMQLYFIFHAPKGLSWPLDFRDTLPCILSTQCLNAQNFPTSGLGLSAVCWSILRPPYIVDRCITSSE